MQSAVEISENQQRINKNRRKRILLLAYACSPYKGSEAGVGWHRAIETAKYFDTWVLHGNREYASDIKQYLKHHGEIPGLNFLYVSETRLPNWIWKLPKAIYISNNFWHRRAYRLAARLHEKLHFDIVHQVTWCGFREPGYLWKLDAHFIWGPVGGTQNYPWRLLAAAGTKGALKEATRSILNMLQLRFQPRVHKAARRADVLLTANSTGKRHFEEIHGVKPLLQLDVGTSSVNNGARFSNGEPLRILWSGLLEYHKALHLLLMALSKTPGTFTYELKILGQGPLEHRLRRLAEAKGVDQHCEWTGWLSHAEAMAQYAWADVLVFTSLRDTCGTVVIEALSHGVPVVCLDHQGAGDVVTEYCGIKIPVSKTKEIVSRLRDALVSLDEDRTKLKALSHGATERAKDYLWSVKGEEMSIIYNQVINNRKKPLSSIGIYSKDSIDKVDKADARL